MSQPHLSHQEVETNKLASEFASEVKPGTVIGLYGELGSGKTTFTKGLARGLGIDKRILSPTFVIMKDYGLPGGDGNLYHLDLYRLESNQDLKALGLPELIKEGENIIVIEWAEKAKSVLPKDAVQIHFKITGPNSREITVK